MASDRAQPSEATGENFSPAAWLIAPTLALLGGQAVAAGPWELPAYTAAVLLVPLLFLLWRQRRRRALVLLLSGAAFAVGYARHRDMLFPEFPENHLRSLAISDARLLLEGSLRHEPEKLVQRTRWHIRAERIWHPTGAEEIAGDILVTVRTVRRDWRYGDRVRFWVRPAAPQDSGNPGGFDYARYLARWGIYATGFLDNDQEVLLLERDPGAIRGVIEDLRREISRFIERNLSPENGALIKALVVGDMGGITKDMRGAFNAAGVSHVLSISGLHVAMLGVVVFVLVRSVGALSVFLLLRCNLLKLATFFSFIAVVFYTALAGAMVPTVRSAIMIGVYELAVLLDREEEVFASLTLAALLIALVWPGVVADISFQLSFLAVLFIVWGMRKIHEWFPAAQTDELPQERSWIKRRLRQAGLHLAVPLLATLGTGPLVAHYFGHLSLAGFIANPLIVPLVGLVVVPLGLGIGFLAILAPALASYLVWIAERLSWLTIRAVEMLANLPMANFAVASPNALEVAGLYGLLLGLLMVTRRSQRILLLGVSLALMTADAVYWWQERYRRSELRVTHLNVGQGDAAVVELPGSKVLLIDAGGAASGEFDSGESIVAPFLRSRKILQVDYLLVSHPRIDHYGGMRAIVAEFSPQEFWAGPSKGQTRRFEELEDALEQANLKHITMHDGEPCRNIDRVKLCALFPQTGKREDGSAVLRLEYGDFKYLFAGDIEKRDETALVQKADELRSAVIKAPRHGSATASTPEFIAAVAPKLAVISAGARSRAEAQREEIVERYRAAGAVVLRTYEDGAITVRSDGSAVRYAAHRSGKTGVIHLAAPSAQVAQDE